MINQLILHRKSHGINDIQLITNRTDTESHQGTIENCMILNNSKARGFHTSISIFISNLCFTPWRIYISRTYNNPTFPVTELVAYPQKLNSYIAQQQKYIQKLEQESRFCRIQLTTLLDNMKMVQSLYSTYVCRLIFVVKYSNYLV